MIMPKVQKGLHFKRGIKKLNNLFTTRALVPLPDVHQYDPV